LSERADLESWIRRLAEAGIEEVISFPPASLELKWMEATPERFEQLANGHGWGMYRFKP
jgi:hypothetical protein